MKPVIFALSLSVFAVTAQAASPQSAVPEEPAQDAPAAFGHIDRDQDGFVSRTEVGTLSGVGQNFDAADANQDGKLDQQEFTQAISAE